MALIDTGPHTVTVYLEEETTDERGNLVRRPKAGGPVTVTGCLMAPVASTRGAFPARDIKEGQRATVAYKLIARNAPVGWWSRVVWKGRTFTPLSGPLVREYSPSVRHISVTLQEER